MLASVNREAITRRGKNVMRYYAATAVPFNEVKRAGSPKGVGLYFIIETNPTNFTRV